MRKVFILLPVLAALGVFYWWAAVDNRMPADAHYELDMDEVRRLAGSLPGDKPADIRYEKVMSFEFPAAMTFAGDPWSGVDIPIYAYQLVYGDHTAMIDSAMPRSIAKPEFMVPFYNDDAYARVQRGIEQATWIVITHEHMDHVGGAAAAPRLRALRDKLKLTAAQLADPDRMKPAVWPPETFDGYVPLQYERYHALAPGVVLIATPGHTPGSQLVYVQRADGRELLFLGDVVWRLHNIKQQGERPRWTTWMINEDRDAVFGQIKTLHALREREPQLALVPGHDGAVIDALTAQQLLRAGFQL